jgi:Kef-type K+ transport system membrane component KefB
VLGFLLAGMAIGPWGLRLIQDPGTVLQFAELGVVLLLFLVGLELEPRRLWALRRPIFGMGGTQVALTIIVFTAIGRLFGLAWPVALAAGMGLAMSSTAIGLATLAEKSLLPTPGGQASFSVLLFQDIAVIPLMLILGMLSRPGDAHAFDWRASAKAVGLIAILIVAGRLLLRPLAALYRADRPARDLHRLLAAARDRHCIADACGGPVDGARRVSRRRPACRLRIPARARAGHRAVQGTAARAVLHSGRHVGRPGAFRSHAVARARLALGVVALKIVLLYPISILFGYCGRADATLFALALSQVGEFAFVLFGVAASQSLLNKRRWTC